MKSRQLLCFSCWVLIAAASANAAVSTRGDFRIEYESAAFDDYTAIDLAIENWMSAYGIHGAQFAFRVNGSLVLSHAYTMGATTPLVTTANVFRLASLSKMA